MAVSRDEIKKVLSELLEKELHVDLAQIKEEDNLRENLNMTSLDAVNIFMSVEEVYNVEVSFEDIEKIRTVGDAINYFESAVNAPKKAE